MFTKNAKASRYGAYDLVIQSELNLPELPVRADGFFFYNAFYENIEPDDAIDTSVDLNARLYELYTTQLTEKLLAMPKGTRLVTYWGEWVPRGYNLVYTNGNDALRFWERG